MQPMTQQAGLGAAIIQSLSGLIAVPIAIYISQYIVNTITAIGIGFVVCGTIAMICIYWANYSSE